MNITNTILTRTATEVTQNASYTLEYTVTNGSLDRIQATIEELSVNENTEQHFIGTIYLEHGNLSCNIPIANEMKTAAYFADFDAFVGMIRQSVSSDAEVSN